MEERIQDLTSREVFARVLRDSIGNTIWFGLGAVVVYFVARWSYVLGVGLFAIYALVIAADALLFVATSLFPSFVTVPNAFRKRANGVPDALTEEGWMLLAMAVKLVEVSIGIAITWYLYKQIWA